MDKTQAKVGDTAAVMAQALQEENIATRLFTALEQLPPPPSVVPPSAERDPWVDEVFAVSEEELAPSVKEQTLSFRQRHLDELTATVDAQREARDRLPKARAEFLAAFLANAKE